MKKQHRMNQGLQVTDKDFESDDDDDDDAPGYRFNEEPIYRNREEVQAPDQHRRLGLDIDMIGAREENLGSTRSESREMRSPHHQEMERIDMTMDNWIQETCYIPAVKNQILSMMHGIIILQMREQNGEKKSLRNFMCGGRKSLERNKKNRCQKG